MILAIQLVPMCFVAAICGVYCDSPMKPAWQQLVQADTDYTQKIYELYSGESLRDKVLLANCIDRLGAVDHRILAEIVSLAELRVSVLNNRGNQLFAHAAVFLAYRIDSGLSKELQELGGPQYPDNYGDAGVPTIGEEVDWLDLNNRQDSSYLKERVALVDENRGHNRYYFKKKSEYDRFRRVCEALLHTVFAHEARDDWKINKIPASDLLDECELNEVNAWVGAQ